MSDLPPSDIMKIYEVANLPEMQDAARWVRAQQIVQLCKIKNCLRLDSDGSTSYMVTPAATVEFMGQKSSKYRIAVRLDGDRMSDTLFLVVNDVIRNPVQIGRDISEPALMLVSKPDVAISANGIDKILSELKASAEQETDEAKLRSQRRKQAVKDFVGGIWRPTKQFFKDASPIALRCIGVTAAIILAISLAGWGISSCVSNVSRSNEERDQRERQTIEDFDKAYPNFVLKGQRVDIGTSGTLKLSMTDITKNVPREQSEKVGNQPRSYTIDTDSCNDITSSGNADKDNERRYDSYSEYGRIAGNEYLILETNAPDDMIHYWINPTGLVSLCASDPANEGSTGPEYTVLMQSRPK